MGIIVVFSGVFALILCIRSVQFSMSRMTLEKDQFLSFFLISLGLFILELIYSLYRLKQTQTAYIFDFHFTLISYCIWHSLLAFGLAFISNMTVKQSGLILSFTAVLLFIGAILSLFLPVYKWLSIKPSY